VSPNSFPHDGSLIARFETLYRGHHSRLVTVIDNRVSDLHEAQDLAARVFELAWEHLTDGAEVTTAWLYACVRNVVGSEYQRRERASRQHLHLVVDSTLSGAEETLAREDEVARAMRTLPPMDQDVLKLVYWHDMRTSDVAVMVGLTDAAVKMRLSRSRASLSALLAPQRGEVTA
jgi:RNA polymerase sigma factor (sigma-70 family)